MSCLVNSHFHPVVLLSIHFCPSLCSCFWRASVASSAPLAILSLLPSILISVAAWTLKSTFLENTDDQSDGQPEEVIVVSRTRKVEDAIKSLKRRSRAMTHPV